ncbi:hypothetical protein ASPCADRAFT_205266 [Aspergillus carbonarius ITEM 5010]|uniref:Uncharacterized protein n=1 Tax=Aspergillus carbonarius (strain ITEM 5010) TaxID=602072 RepID=A0A1R3RU24_ASPC5|nr:hypothetical protein ASPCADRAFT_205266 [Aspergillus carbonarius ITEM 5010]
MCCIPRLPVSRPTNHQSISMALQAASDEVTMISLRPPSYPVAWQVPVFVNHQGLG